jgi:hypothetical protein
METTLNQPGVAAQLKATLPATLSDCLEPQVDFHVQVSSSLQLRGQSLRANSKKTELYALMDAS